MSFYKNDQSSNILTNNALTKIFNQCKKTAGCWFIVKYIKDIEKKYNELLDLT